MLGGASLRAGSSAANAFDGVDTNAAVFDGNSSVGGGYEIQFSPAVVGSSVKITGYADTRDDQGNPQLELSVNGGTPVLLNSKTSEQFAETFSVTSLKSIKYVLTKSGTTNAGQGISQVEVDGVVLIDSTGIDPLAPSVQLTSVLSQ